jgi:RNA polymerase sigma-70 factor (ECF subfamily)
VAQSPSAGSQEDGSRPPQIRVAPRGRTTGIDSTGAGRERVLDSESRAWLAALTHQAARRDEALARLHALLERVARFQLSRRATTLQLRGESIAELATEAADDALVAVLAHLDDFRGESRFATWACKFAVLNVSTTLRRRLWKERESPAIGEDVVEDAHDGDLERLELWELLRRALRDVLTERQRAVFVAVAVNGVPIDVVADRFATNRGAIYKTLHDARRKLREALEAADAPASAGLR